MKFQVTIDGRTLDELKKAVADIYNQLNAGDICNGMKKDMSVDRTLKDAMVNIEDLEDKEDVIAIEQPAPTPVDEPILMVEPPIEDIKPEISPVNGAELDSEGLPWDTRIHGMGKSKVANGTWRLKRGIDKDYVTKVKNEIRTIMLQAANKPVVPEAPVNNTTPVIETPVAPVIETPVAPVEPAPAPAVLPSMNTHGHSAETFIKSFPMIMANLITEGKITRDYVNQLNDYFKVTEIHMITNEQKLELLELFSNSGLVTKVG